MKRTLLVLFLLLSLISQELNAQCGTNATFVGSSTLVSGSGDGSPAHPYTAGSVVRVTVTVGGTYVQAGGNWWHGVQINLGSDFSFATPLNFSRTGFPGNGRWTWSYGFTGNGPGSAGPGVYYDQDNDGNPGNNYGRNTTTLSGTFRFNVVVTGTNTSTAGISANIMSDGFSGNWNTSTCDADALSAAAISVLSNISLPVTLVSVKARKINTNDIELTWQTATEQNVSHFEIEYSPDGRNWTTIGTKQATGNSNILQTYTYIHNQPPGPDFFYRIRSVDQDGRAEYSKVVSVRKDYTTDFMFEKIYPNPVRDKVGINLVAPDAAKAVIALYNATGTLMSEMNINLEKGLNTYSMDLQHLKKGIYLLIFRTGDISIAEKIIKQ
ncbi:MAG: T9SS type A sorting domain-containing protein [Terrimonas sp.]|nr:T9SS type A sorting domain-containing protein [Terrimonas sp.]